MSYPLYEHYRRVQTSVSPVNPELPRTRPDPNRSDETSPPMGLPVPRGVTVTERSNDITDNPDVNSSTQDLALGRGASGRIQSESTGAPEPLRDSLLRHPVHSYLS